MELIPIFSGMLQQLDSVIGLAEDLRGLRSGTVRIGCLPSVAATFLPPHIARFRKSYPNIYFSLRDAFGDHIISMIRSGEVEFGMTDVWQEEIDLENIPLLEEQMCVLYLHGHPIEKADKIDVEELSKHDLILMIYGSNARRVIDLAFAKQGRVATPTCEATYITTAVGMVRAQLGIALLPNGGLQRGVDPRLRIRSIDAAGFTRHIALVKLRGRSMSPAAQAFMSFTRNIKNPVVSDSDLKITIN